MKTTLHSIAVSALAVILIGFSLNTYAQTTLLSWQFGVPQSLGNEPTYSSTTTHASAATSLLSRGSGLTPRALQRGFSGEFINWVATGTTKANAITNNDYFEFSFTAKTNYTANLGSIESRLRRSSAGPNAYRWMYSINGAAFIEIGVADVSFTDSNGEGVIQPSVDLSNIPALQNLSSTSTIRFRLYVWGETTNTGTFAIARYPAASTTPSLELKGTATLPISLISFTGENENNAVKLTWRTASERNNSHFEVLRSSDDQKEESIAIVNGEGNSNSVNAYFFTDYNPLNGNNYYTLKQFDFDGKATTVGVCAVNTPFHTNQFQVLTNNDPNAISFSVNSDFSGASTIQIIDLGGQVKATSILNLQKGTHQIAVPITLAKGIYVATFSNAKEQMTFKFSK
ncbi:T9SS type A sorting domain-containing protein [Pedobacter alpinus]|uniref:T9SS type A sorting domain-containing protein n=1 Tax=Pedobacter alpinus TaxID=1590643 RepID=A0ABW5TSC6_9SPHI